MSNLSLQKAEEPEITLPAFTGSEIAREYQKDIYICFIDYAKAFDCVDHNKLWKTLKEMGIPDHLICLLWNLYVGQEATVSSCMEQLPGSRLRKESDNALYCHSVYLTYMQSTWDEMPVWISYKLESRLWISTTSDNADDNHSNGRKWKGSREPLDEGEGGKWKSWLKLNRERLRSWHLVPSFCK